MVLTDKKVWTWHSGLDADLYKIRKHLHQNPELSFQEFETSQYICSWLDHWGIPYKKICETGVIVDIWGEMGEGPQIALRADVDALPINERTGLSFSSKKSNVMHACGHDGHTTILLGAVYHLWHYKSQLKGMVRCIFQPGEEAEGAAKKMIEEGVLDNPQIQEMIALHLWPKLPLGTIGIKTEGVTASCDDFSIEIRGKGGHAARPHQAVDAIAIGAEVIKSLQFLSAKNQDPVDPLVIHVGKINGGSANNAVADKVTIEGTIRTISTNARTDIKSKFLKLISGIIEQYGGEVNINYVDGHPAVINDLKVTDKVIKSAARIIGENHIIKLPSPSMGADDFGFYSEKIPSTYFRLGIAEENQEFYDLHHPKFQFDESVIPIGAQIFIEYAMNCLKGE
ncbi:M20 metallopeptidase family protein [Scopulibacillus cellulosilyticus]|uniref:M20 family metallopeptidase n=1 Tax=Scopulibacillus cellulosilyticus TaxID=2665665 RepID=A0ABW2PZQ3_9BACL